MTQQELIAELLKQQSAQSLPSASAPPTQPNHSPAARTRRSASGSYGTALYKAAILVALLLMVGVWYTGGSFTLAALTSWGLPVASWGLLAWLIPLSVTALEIGALMGRARLPALWVVWVAVLAFDVATTAIGLLDLAEGRRVFGHTFSTVDSSSITIGGIIGLVIALTPEPSIRALIRELFS